MSTALAVCLLQLVLYPQDLVPAALQSPQDLGSCWGVQVNEALPRCHVGKW